jgi:uncharacterized delta-60 repeat protein
MPTFSFKPRSLSMLSMLIPLLGAGSLGACGGDDDDSPSAGAGGTAGKGGSGGKGGTAGKGGSAGKGGTGSGGTAGKGSGGSAGKATGGTAGNGGDDAGSGGVGGDDTGVGGTGGDGTAGEDPGGNGGTGGDDTGVGGEGGTDPGPVTFKTINRTRDLLLAGVNDLRGLTFASSGKIYASGHIGVNTDVDREIAIVRFNADGTLDDTFGTAGVVRMNVVPRVVDTTGEAPVVVNNGSEESLGIVELSDNSFVLQVNARDATGTGTDVLLVKVDAAGTRVAGFGTNGVKRVDFGWIDETDNASWPTAGATPADQAWGLRVDRSTATEKLVLFGFGPAKRGSTTGTPPAPVVQRTDNDRYVTRVLASDGSIDPGFNGGAPYTLNSGGTFGDNGRRGIVLADGTIFSGGYTNFGEGLGNHVMLIKLKPDGTPDTSFRFGINAPGVSRFNPFLTDGGVAECYGVARQSTGRLVTTGYGRATAANTLSSYGYATSSNVDLVSFGVLPNGSLDTSFGIESTVAFQSELVPAATDFEDRGRDLLTLPDDRVVFVGKYGANPTIFVAKPDGTLDEGSGDAASGRFAYAPLVRAADPNAIPPVTALTTSHFYAVAVSADGKKIAATSSNHELGVRAAFLSVAD